ncbi:MAG: hypothetical protein HY400_05400 [Elusimicrobia bacterium]|nr:hypothetical protein [Elusimicrobiota bacterium]
MKFGYKLCAFVLIFTVWASVGRAEEITGQEACKKLLDKAAGFISKNSAESLSCYSVGKDLMVKTDSSQVFSKLQSELFPQDVFMGYSVRPAPDFTAPDSGPKKQDQAAGFRSVVEKGVDFDGAGVHAKNLVSVNSGIVLANFTPATSGGVFYQQPGAGSGAGNKSGKKKGGQPGSGSGQPGSGSGQPGNGSGQPGSGNGDDVPPPDDNLPAKRSRPSGPPSTFPSYPPDLPYYDDRADGTGYWHLYTDFLGRPYRMGYGEISQDKGKKVFQRGGSNTQIGQDSTYRYTLQSKSYRNVYALYWRYVGRDCDSYDTDRCRYWEVQYRYFLYEIETIEARSMAVVINFANDQALLPWEKEEFEVQYDGSQIVLKQRQTAYRYREDGPYIDQKRGEATLTLTQGQKLLTPPDPNGVGLRLVKRGNSLFLVIEDKWAKYYQGEVLEIDVVVKWDKPWSLSNPKVYEAHPYQMTGPSVEIPIPTQKSGEYWVDGWKFRRAGGQGSVGSKISSGDLINKGEGNKIKL